MVVSDARSGGAAARTAHEPGIWQAERRGWRGRIIACVLVVVVLGAAGWVASSETPTARQIQSYITTAHAETIFEDSIALKPHSFSSYRVTVPESAIEVAISGQFESSGRTDNEVQVLILTESEFVAWQSGYAGSPYYDSGKGPKGDIEASLPSRGGSYFLIVSNKQWRTEKTVRLSAALHYATWLPDSVVQVKEKIRTWYDSL